MSEFATIEASAGSFLLLACVSILLSGIFIAQVYSYWFSYDDSRAIKGFVISILLLEFFQLAVSFQYLYVYFVADIGDVEKLSYIVWSVDAGTFVKIVVIALAQGFGTYRIWQMSNKNKLITAIPAVILFVASVFGITTMVFIIRLSTWEEFFSDKKTQGVTNTAFALYAVVDIVIAALLTFYLHKHRTSFRRTHHAVQRLKIYIINTGALSAICSIITSVTANVCQDSLVYSGMLMAISKIYINGVMAMLNMRKSIKEGLDSNDGIVTIPLAFQRTQTGRQTTPYLSAEVPVDHVQLGTLKETSAVVQSLSISDQADNKTLQFAQKDLAVLA